MKKPKTATPNDELFVPIPILFPLAKIQSAPYNPRTVTKDDIASLKASIRQRGFLINLVVQKHSPKYGDNVLVGGHQRIRAVRELCDEMKWKVPEALPTIVLDLTDVEAKKLNVALNKIQGEFEPYMLGELLQEIRPEMTHDDYQAIGFSTERVDELINLVTPPELPGTEEDEKPGGFASSVTLSVEFDTVDHRDEAKAVLQRMVDENPKKKAGQFLLECLKAARATRRRRA